MAMLPKDKFETVINGTGTFQINAEDLALSNEWIANSASADMGTTMYTPIFYNVNTATDSTSTRMYFSDTNKKIVQEDVDSMLKLELRATIQEEIKKIVGDIDALKIEKEELVKDIQLLQLHYQAVKKDLIDDIELLESSLKQRMEAIARFTLLQI